MSEVPQDRLSREELYRLVWEKPATAVAKDLGVSGSIITRVCRELNVPKPPLGYWAKVAHGHKVRKPRLPALKPGDKEEWQIERANVEGQLTAAERRKQSDAIELADDTREWLYGDLPEHKWIKATRSALKETRSSREGRLYPKRDLPHLSLSVTQDGQRRALAFFNRLIHLAESEKICVGLDTPVPPKRVNPWERMDVPGQVITFHWNGQSIGIHLNEKVRRAEKPDSRSYDRYEFHSTGFLECSLVDVRGYEGRYHWKDGKLKQIEEFIPSIVAAIKAAGEEITVYLAKRAIAEERQRRMDSMMAALRRQEQEEESAARKAVDDAVLFAQAETLRNFAKAAESRFTACGRVIEPGSGIALWLQWLHLRADMIDPLATGKAPWHPFVTNVLKSEP